MATKAKIARNKQRLELINRNWAKRAELKKSIKSFRSDKPKTDDIMALVFELAAMKRDSSPSRYRNRCNINGRPRGYDGKTGLCRNEARRLAGEGMLPGMIKSSW